ncbi:MAG: response regulator [Gammaproteobacteria bacterium]|nr:response regulator [Gammaproteobacteria bacterium]MDH5303795.1 response regulator [Gammaproteobacteria bacterium]MDH5323258.1 response regulator [Gammaproteobacteria bacterium]
MSSILLIDDEFDVRSAVAKVLSREGFEVSTAENVEQGLKLLDKHHFDVLITDVIMPGIDGVQAIRLVREINPDIKVIAISGGGNFGPKSYQPQAITTTAYLQAATTAGADWVLTKPFQKADIVDAVRQLVSPA